MLHDELHIHLYGCLKAQHLATYGRDHWRERADRLNWYADEYLKAWGRRPDWQSYFESGDEGRFPDGTFTSAPLQRDFEFLEAQPFHRFQACFNLAIALFPVDPKATTVLDLVMASHRDEGLRYVEYRCPVPPTLDPKDLGPYFLNHARSAERFEGESGGAFAPRLVFSLSRLPSLFKTQYQELKSIMSHNLAAKNMIVALDLCGKEEGNPPRAIAPSLALVHEDNRRDPERSLAILYHVGESFEDLGLLNSIRWVYQAQSLGAHRLGHALSLAMDPALLATERGWKSYREPTSERIDHLKWLLKEQTWLEAGGYPVASAELKRELADLQGRTSQEADSMIETPIDSGWIEEARLLQKAVMKRLKSMNAIFECCPTSNLRIGRLGSVGNHPLKRFQKLGLNTLLASDDPGIFATTLAKEVQLALSHGLLDSAELGIMAQNLNRWRSRELVFSLRHAPIATNGSIP